METIKFKTNIKCGACVAKVKPHLDAAKDIENWEVDLKDPERTLTVTLKSNASDNVLKALESAGYQGSKK